MSVLCLLPTVPAEASPLSASGSSVAWLGSADSAPASPSPSPSESPGPSPSSSATSPDPSPSTSPSSSSASVSGDGAAVVLDGGQFSVLLVMGGLVLLLLATLVVLQMGA